jgi:hypothetical protein
MVTELDGHVFNSNRRGEKNGQISPWMPPGCVEWWQQSHRAPVLR